MSDEVYDVLDLFLDDRFDLEEKISIIYSNSEFFYTDDNLIKLMALEICVASFSRLLE